MLQTAREIQEFAFTLTFDDIVGNERFAAGSGSNDQGRAPVVHLHAKPRGLEAAVLSTVLTPRHNTHTRTNHIEQLLLPSIRVEGHARIGRRLHVTQQRVPGVHQLEGSY